MKFVRSAAALTLASAATVVIGLFATAPAQADTSWDIRPGGGTSVPHAAGMFANDTSWD